MRVTWNPPSNIDRFDIDRYIIYIPSRNITDVSFSTTIDLTIPNCRDGDNSIILVAAMNRLGCVGPNSSPIRPNLDIPTIQMQDDGISRTGKLMNVHVHNTERYCTVMFTVHASFLLTSIVILYYYAIAAIIIAIVACISIIIAIVLATIGILLCVRYCPKGLFIMAHTYYLSHIMSLLQGKVQRKFRYFFSELLDWVVILIATS